MRQGAWTWYVLGLFGFGVAIVFLILTAHVHILQMASIVMLGTFAVSMLWIGWVLWSGRFTDPIDQPGAEAQVGPEHVFPPSWAPPLLALGIALAVVGVRFTPVLIAVGGILVMLTLFTWIVQRVDVAHMMHGSPHAESAGTPEIAGTAEVADPPAGVNPGGPGPTDWT